VPVPSRRVPSDDERAIERYRYLIRTAPPETIERVHAEAFARLTEEQRAVIYEELSRGAGTGERPLSSESATLARSATRLEMRRPGSFERILQPGSAGGPGQAHGPGVASMVGSSLLGSVAGYVIGSALVSAFLPWGADDGRALDGEDPVAGDANLGDADGFDLLADFGF